MKCTVRIDRQTYEMDMTEEEIGNFMSSVTLAKANNQYVDASFSDASRLLFTPDCTVLVEV